MPIVASSTFEFAAVMKITMTCFWGPPHCAYAATASFHTSALVLFDILNCVQRCLHVYEQ